MVNSYHMPVICLAAGFLDCVIIMSSTRMSIIFLLYDAICQQKRMAGLADGVYQRYSSNFPMRASFFLSTSFSSFSITFIISLMDFSNL